MTENAKTILIIDDSEDDREFFAELFNRASSGAKYTVLTAGSAEDGIAVYQKNDVDCTLIDYNMPGENGLDAIQSLKELTDQEHIPAIIFTGEHSQKLQASAARHGAMDYVIKDSIYASEQIEKIVHKVISWADHLTE